MSAESLLREVDEKRKKTIQMLESEYAAKKAEVQNRAKEQRDYILDSSRNEAAVHAQREGIRITGAAKLQSKKILFDATEKMLENNIAVLQDELSNVSGSRDYSNLLAKMLAYASKRLGPNTGVVCRASDAATLKKLGARIVSSDLERSGGFKAVSGDGTLELDLTFEELLRNHEEEVRAFILGKE